MKFLTIFALALALATGQAAGAAALESATDELKSRNIVVPAESAEGRTAQGGQFPYQVGLLLQAENGNLSWCGGALLSNSKVLTAAHCITQATKNASVYLGSTRWKSAEVIHNVTRRNFIIHPRWKGRVLLNDIAIIDIPYTPSSKNIQPVKLPASGSFYSSYDGDEVVASGWGRISEHSDGIATDLRFAHMNVMPNRMCRSYYDWVARKSNVCVATYSGVSTCNGDSGGPLVLESTKTLIGLTAFGSHYGCQRGSPAVVTRLTSYLEWIRDNAGV